MQENILSEDCKLMRTPQQVFIQGKDCLKKSGFRSLESIPGFELMKPGLKNDLGVSIGNALQLQAAAYIFAGRNCFLIGPANSKAGKSLSYLMPILGSLMSNAQAGVKTEGSGPLALIVCSSNQSGVRLEDAMSNLIGNHGDTLKAVFLEENYSDVGKRPGRNIKNRYEKYDVILATAGCVAEMIEKDIPYFSYDRLWFLVFDDAHILLKYKAKEVKTIIKGFQTYVDKAGPRPCLQQTIFCGSQWTKEIEEVFVHCVHLPVLVISSPVQVLQYCNFDIRVVKAGAGREDSFKEFKGILEKHSDVKRILVVASHIDTMKDLAVQCRNEGIIVNDLGMGNVGVADIARAQWNWESKHFDRVIILTTDLSLHELKIDKATFMIHYDVPVDDFRAFALRFSAMWGNARDLTQEYSNPQHEVISYVIIPPNLPQEGLIVTTLHKLGAKIPLELLESAKETEKLSIEGRKLCRGFKCFGKCIEFDESTCKNRHYFIENDFEEPSVLPTSGQVQIRIKELMTPNHLRVQVVRYQVRDPTTNRVIQSTDCVAEVLKRSEHLHQKFKNDDVMPASSFKPGTKVFVAHREKIEYKHIYTRAEVMKVQTRNYMGFPTSVLVNCMDIGETLEVDVDNVFALPSEMENLPAYGVELILANTEPPLGELDFRITQYSKARDVLQMRELKDIPILDAEIALSIGNIIWVKRLVQRQTLQCGLVTEIWDATNKLVQAGVLIRNPNLMDQLYELCEKANFSCQMYKTESLSISWKDDFEFVDKFHQLGDPIDWAHLKLYCDKDSRNPTSCSASTKYVSQSEGIYMTVNKFESLIEKLEEEMDAEIRSLKKRQDFNLEKKFHDYYAVGIVVAVLDTNLDEYYHRGIITEVTDNCSQDGVEFNVFLVDLGGYVKSTLADIFPIPKEFVKRIPFQINNIQLLHINFLKPKTPKGRFSDRLIEFLLPGGQSLDVEVVALEKIQRKQGILPNSYHALIFGDTEEVGEKFVKDKAAVYIDDWESRALDIKNLLLDKFRKVLDERLTPWTDDDDDDGLDCDVNFDCSANVLVAAIYGPTVTSDLFIEELHDNDPSETVSNGDSAISLNNSMESSFASTSSTSSVQSDAVQSSSRPNEGTKVVPSASGKSMKKPTVTWYEKNDNIFVKVLIPDIKKFECNISKDKLTLHYKTVIPPDYAFDLNLLRRVEINPAIAVWGQYCEIKLTKQLKGFEWSRITKEKGLSWLKPDFTVFSDGSTEVEEKTEQVVYTPVNYEQLADNNGSSDEDFLDDGTNEVFEDLY